MGSPACGFLKQNNVIFLRHFMILVFSCFPDRTNLFSNHCCDTPNIPPHSGYVIILLSLKTLTLDGYFSFENLEHAAKDFGNIYHYLPVAVLHPKSVSDISSTIKNILNMGSASKLTVAARGHGHSFQGQAQAYQGVVINMESLERSSMYVKTGEVPYADVLGISGQAFRHGLQINNVYQLEVVTGRGEVITCSDKKNADLFYGVLGGLGQFGIITRARISLGPAEKMVRERELFLNCGSYRHWAFITINYPLRHDLSLLTGEWIRVLYSEFSTFSNDQEHLISSENSFDYIEGFVIINRTGLLNNWRSSFNPKDPIQASQFSSEGKILYCLEMAKYSNPDETDNLNQNIEKLLSGLNYIPSTLFLSEVSYVEFLDRVHLSEIKTQIKRIMGRSSSMAESSYTQKQNFRLCSREEDIIYLVAFLSSALPSSTGTDSLEHIMSQNKRILDFCSKAQLGAKQYMPHYSSQNE
ncbi:hypothetical protein CRYUN_Cryun05aG0069900 [Craigia yunnanensis]